MNLLTLRTKDELRVKVKQYVKHLTVTVEHNLVLLLQGCSDRVQPSFLFECTDLIGRVTSHEMIYIRYSWWKVVQFGHSQSEPSINIHYM